MIPGRSSVAAMAFAVIVFTIVCASNAPLAKEVRTPKETPTWLKRSLDSSPLPAARRAMPDTTVIGSWDFEGCDAQGWTVVDNSAPYAIFTHIDDFAGLGGGINGLLVAPNGNQAMWCGARPDTSDLYICSYASLPGYGNRWEQYLSTSSPASGTGLTVSFAFHWDSEPGYDRTVLEFDDATDGSENWINLGVGTTPISPHPSMAWEGTGTDTISVSIPDSVHGGAVNLHFKFTSDGAWSDEDGLWDTDGAFIVDDIEVTAAAGAGLALEDFEGEAVGSTVADDWEGSADPGFGDFSTLFPALSTPFQDDCVSNISCMWGFFAGSGSFYTCGGNNFPAQEVVPFAPAFEPGIDQELVSPWVTVAGAGASWELHFDVYEDLPLTNLIFFTWSVRGRNGFCPMPWLDRNFVYYGPNPRWRRHVQPVGDLLIPTPAEVQVRLGVIDMCFAWCGIYGTGACHSFGPLFDNVSIIRFDGNGPQWRITDRTLFQDSFADDGTTTGVVRMDMGADILSGSSPNILLGDSAVVAVSDEEHALAGDPFTGFGPAVYLYARVEPAQAPKSGSAMTQDSFRFPVVGTVTIDSEEWTCLRVDTAFTNSASRTGALSDVYCVDLNDNLFTPGDEVKFFFGAENTEGQRTYWGIESGTTDDMMIAALGSDEVTCLPSGNASVLYVDGDHTFGDQPFLEPGIAHVAYDRFDVRGSDGYNDNRLGYHISDVAAQLNSVYDCIVWSTGTINRGFGDGTGNPEKTNDTQVLYEFLENATNPGGIYLVGDNFAEAFDALGGASATLLRNKYFNFSLTDGSHLETSLPVSPTIVGEPGRIFEHGGMPDTLMADGSCLNIYAGWGEGAGFDVLDATGASVVAARYEGADGAVLTQETLNPNGQPVRTVLGGFAISHIVDDKPAPTPDYVDHVRDVMDYLSHSIPVSTPPSAPRVNELTQNYPNPFNPTTTISYSLANRAHVQLKVYNVSGQLVRTLVDQVQTPAQVAPITWDGTNNAGTQVSSGVYFYRLVAGDFVRTRKMVLLK